MGLAALARLLADRLGALGPAGPNWGPWLLLGNPYRINEADASLTLLPKR